MNDSLRPADRELHGRLGIPADLLALVGVKRVTDAEARALLSSRHPGDLAGLVYPYHDPQTGQSVACRVRRDHPEIENGKARDKYLSAFGDRRHLYFPPGAAAVLADVSVPIVMCEAEKSALAIMAAAARAGRPVLAIGTGGCWGWKGRVGKAIDPSGAHVDEKGPLADFDRVVWGGRDAIVMFDSNAATSEKVQAARRALSAELAGRREAKVRIAAVPVEAHVNGPDDYIGKHGDAALFALIDAATPPKTEPRGEKRESQATAIVRRALDAGADLWHTPTGDPYATIRVADHREHHALTGRAMRDYLSRLHYLAASRAPNASALQDAIATLSGMARFDGAPAEACVRVAGDGVDRVYLDLGDQQWRAIEITPDGWQEVKDPPVRFRRPKGMLPLPLPMPGGSIDNLGPFLNVASESDFVLMVTWALAALRPRGPYPILVFMAEQGAAKTTTTRVLRRLCDPNDADVRRPPRNTEDLMIAATNGHVVAFDNLSRLSEELSDNLSVLATGGGFAVRQLYTNTEEQIFHAQKPIILNGISQVATRGDLLDRAIVMTLPPIREENRKDEATFWSEFEQAHPRILGAFLSAVACGLRRVRNVQLARKPRMADFALWSVATEPTCPWPEGTFLQAYAGNRQGAVEATLDGDPLVDVVRVITPWTGTATELLGVLTLKVPDETRQRKGWFTRPREVSNALRRLAPGLRGIGIEVDFLKHGHNRTRLIEITRSGASASSASSADPDSQGAAANAGADAEEDGSASSASASAQDTNVYGGADAVDAADATNPLLSDDGAAPSPEDDGWTL